MALTQTDLDRLDAAIATSELEVRFGDGHLVRYRTTAELIAARDHVAGVLRASAAQAARTSRTTLQFNFVTGRGD